MRDDGRNLDELRPPSVELGLIHTADGSCRWSSGGSCAIAAARGPAVPRSLKREDPENLVIDVSCRCAVRLEGFIRPRRHSETHRPAAASLFTP